MWHDRANWDSSGQVFTRYQPWFHAFLPEWGTNGKHIVGDPATGKLYEMSTNYSDDDGIPILYRRAFPHLLNENMWNYHHRLEVYCESGTVTGGRTPPNITLDYSNDRGHSFINPYAVSMGAAGSYRWRSVFRRLGKARDRVYRVSIQSQEQTALIDTFLEMTPGTA